MLTNNAITEIPNAYLRQKWSKKLYFKLGKEKIIIKIFCITYLAENSETISPGIVNIEDSIIEITLLNYNYRVKNFVVSTISIKDWENATIIAKMRGTTKRIWFFHF
jgi:hypothetical protein